MNDAKYIGLDMHHGNDLRAVRDSDGKLVMEAILETKAETILQFIHGLRGSLHVTFEERHLCSLVVRLAQAPMSRKCWCVTRGKMPC